MDNLSINLFSSPIPITFFCLKRKPALPARQVIKESKNRGKAPLYPMLARLNPSALRASGLQTLLAKVK
jgi:hypothetical protein